MEPVPLEVSAKIGQFTNCQWQMMALLAWCPGAFDLVQSTPALAFALASNWVFRDTSPCQSMRSACRLVRLRQAEICGCLGFPVRPSTVRILRKLRAADISIKVLLRLRNGLRDAEAAKLLRHCPVITGTVIAIATNPALRRHFSPRFLANLHELEGETRPQENERLHLLDEFMLLEILALLRPTQIFDSITQVEQFAEEFFDYLPCCPPELKFRLPPLPGTDSILPLTCGRDLLDESDEMEHCVESLYGEAASGEMYFYRVLAPGRATLCLKRDEGMWLLDEVQGPRNSAVTQDTFSAIYAWLDSSRK